MEAGGDVLGEVVEVECLLRNEVVFLKRVVIDRWIWLNTTGFVGEDVPLEEREDFWEAGEKGLRVESIGIGEKDESEPSRF